MIPLPELHSRLSKHGELFETLTFDALSRFFNIISRYMPLIMTSSPRVRKGLPRLGDSIRNVVALALSLPYNKVDTLWSATCDLLSARYHQIKDPGSQAIEDGILAKAGPQFALGVQVMIPPVQCCTRDACPERGRPLGGDRKVFMGTLFSHGRGVLPVQVVTLYCRACKTTYRPNYSVCNADSTSSVREYYAGVPKHIEVTQHCYVEDTLIQLFRHQMAFMHGSGDGCAKVYNLSFSKDPYNDSKMTSEIVWNAFYIHALLLHHSRYKSRLEFLHHGEQMERIAAALKDRNEQMVGVGQPEWAHACDMCERLVKVDGADARLSACVMDGVCIGHPRCHVYHCTERLLSPRERYCQTHRALDSVCAIQGCELPSTDGMRTCATPEHRQIEEDRRQKGRAMFELKRRLQARHVASSIRAEPSVDPSSDLLDDSDEMDDPATTSNVERKKASSAAPKIKTSLSRRWTHNEQLLVRPCGVVVSRATFYEAESVPNCRLFLNATFPRHFPRSRPSFLFFDNNCKLLSHLVNVWDEHLLHMGFPVDVFHAVNKHQQSDAYCQENCNPAGFPELIDDENQWTFNSSACEQVNVWFAKFLPIVRKMSEIHFNFFLDEMILIHNEARVRELTRSGRCPRLVPLEELS